MEALQQNIEKIRSNWKSRISFCKFEKNGTSRRIFFGTSIKYQFFRLTLVAVILLIIVQTWYYMSFSTATKDKTKLYTDNIVSQIEDTLSMQFDKVRNAATYFSYSSAVQLYMSTDDPFVMYDSKSMLDDMMRTVITINTEIVDVSLVDRFGKSLYTHVGITKNMSEMIDSILRKFEEYKGEKRLLYLNKNEFNAQSFLIYAMPVQYVNPDSRLGESLGYTIIYLEPRFLARVTKEGINPDIGELYIIDEEGEILESSTQINEDEKFSEEKVLDAYKQGKVVTRRKIGATGLEIIGAVKSVEVLKEYNFLIDIAMMMGIMTILLFIANGVAFGKNIGKPIAKLLSEINRAGKSNLYTRINVPYKNEIGTIAEHINNTLDSIENMSRKIYKTQQTLYETELNKKQTELYALQSQVNPHFLFNTLQCISGIAVSKDIPEVEEAALAMAEIFKYSIKEGNYVKVEDEVKIAEQYLKIIDLRLSGRLQWYIDLPPEMNKNITIKMILQPIVENAIYHGIEKRYEGGNLRIAGNIYNDHMLIEIWDNGPGFTRSNLEYTKRILSDMSELEAESAKRKRIGLANIQLRIKLMLGEEYGIDVFSSKNEGTLVKVKLPILTMNEAKSRIHTL